MVTLYVGSFMSSLLPIQSPYTRPTEELPTKWQFPGIIATVLEVPASCRSQKNHYQYFSWVENTTSLCQTTASPGGVWTAQLDPQNSRWQAGLRPVSPPTKEKVIQMSQLNSWILFIPFCLGSTVCTLVMVFQNNTILNGKALDDATLDEMELSHTLP